MFKLSRNSLEPLVEMFIQYKFKIIQIKNGKKSLFLEKKAKSKFFYSTSKPLTRK